MGVSGYGIYLSVDWKNKTFKMIKSKQGNGHSFYDKTGDVMTGDRAVMIKISPDSTSTIKPIAEAIESVMPQKSNDTQDTNPDPRYYGEWVDDKGRVQLIVNEKGVTRNGQPYYNGSIDERMNIARFDYKSGNYYWEAVWNKKEDYWNLKQHAGHTVKYNKNLERRYDR